MAQDIVYSGYPGYDATFKAAITAASRTLSFKLEVMWDGTSAFQPNGTWTDETSYLSGGELFRCWVNVDERGSPIGLGDPSGSAISACALEMNNEIVGSAGRYTPRNASSPIYTYIRDGKAFYRPVRLWIGFGGTNIQVFNGVLSMPTIRARQATAPWTVYGREKLLLENRKSSPSVYLNQRVDQAIKTLMILGGFRDYAGGLPVVDYDFISRDAADTYAYTTLSNDVAAADTTLPVASTAALATAYAAAVYNNLYAGKFIQIDDECIRITSGPTGTSISVARGQRGTTATIHTNGAKVIIPTTLDVISDVLPWVYVDDESIWEECQKIATGALCKLYTEWNGLVYLRSPEWLYLNRATSIATLSGDSEEEFELSVQPSNVVNSVVVTTQSFEPASLGVVYTHNGALIVPAGSTVDLDVKLDYPCFDVVTPRANVDYVARPVGSPGNLTAFVTCAKISQYVQRLVFRFTNSHPNAAASLYNVKIYGRPLVARPSRSQRASGGTYSIASASRAKSIGGPYFQSDSLALKAANFILDRLGDPLNEALATSIQADPTLEMGDRLTINQARLGASFDAYLMAMTLRFHTGRQADLTAEYHCLDVTNVFPAYNYFIWGASTIGSGKKAWY